VDRIVTSAYQYGRVVTEVNLVLDRKTKDVNRELSGAYNHAVVREELTADPAVTAVIEKWQPLYDAFANEIVGSISADINRGGTPPGSDRGVESAAGNLVADAQAWATRDFGSEVAFMNPGGVRSDLSFTASGAEANGEVTFGEAFTFQPFNIVKNVATDGSCTATITNVKINEVPLDMNAQYRVAVNSFLADGGDNFSSFTQASARVSWGLDLDALTSYLGENSPVAPPATNRVNELN
jgi:5'-nucleotidase